MIKQRLVNSWRTSIIGLGLIAVGAYLVTKDQIAFGSILIPAGLGFLGYKEKK